MELKGRGAAQLNCVRGNLLWAGLTYLQLIREPAFQLVQDADQDIWVASGGIPALGRLLPERCRAPRLRAHRHRRWPGVRVFNPHWRPAAGH